MVKLLVAKILCMVGVFFFMLLGSLLPVKIIETDFEKAHRSKKILSLCNTFGGGVFLATCFNALLPAVREKARSGVLAAGTSPPGPGRPPAAGKMPEQSNDYRVVV
ncbi:T0181386 isoform 1, partial [Pan troglodytes]